MAMNRRSFLLGAGAVLASTLGHKSLAAQSETIKNLPVCSKESQRGENEIDGFSNIPEVLKEKTFWGYAAINLKSDIMPIELSAGAYNGMQMMQNKDVLELNNKSFMTATCRMPKDGVRYRFHITGETLREDQRSIHDTLLSSIQSTLNDYADKQIGYEERVDNIILILANIYRAIDYSHHLDWMGAPKTPVQLESDNTGDCKDFALARYLIASRLGVKHEHMMIIEYIAEDNRSAHANIAIYSPSSKEWTIVEGTGRNPGEELGATLICQNDQQGKEKAIKQGWQYSRMIPVMAYNKDGVWAFDSIAKKNLNGTYVFKDAQNLPDSNKPLYWASPSTAKADPARPQPQDNHGLDSSNSGPH